MPEIGERIAQSVTEYFKNAKHRAFVEKLRKAGLQLEAEEKEIILESNKLEGNTFVISGVFQTFGRDELKEVIERNGGKVVSSISAKLSYLVAGENMGPAKLEKATKLNIKILTEDEFKKLLES